MFDEIGKVVAKAVEGNKEVASIGSLLKEVNMGEILGGSSNMNTLFKDIAKELSTKSGSILDNGFPDVQIDDLLGPTELPKKGGK